jgi:hypothetical protein
MGAPAILIRVVDFGIEIEIGIGIDGKDGNSTPIRFLRDTHSIVSTKHNCIGEKKLGLFANSNRHTLTSRGINGIRWEEK